MLALLVTLLLMLLIVTAVLLAVGALVVVPAFLSAGRAEQRGLDASVWGTIGVAASVLGLLLALAVRESAPPLIVLALLGWVVPVVAARVNAPAAPPRHR